MAIPISGGPNHDGEGLIPSTDWTKDALKSGTSADT